MPSSFFNEVTLFKRILYSTCILYVLCTAIAVLIEPYLTLPCDDYIPTTTTTKLTFPNPFYTFNPCQSTTRYLQLVGLTRLECEFGRNMVMSVLLGSIIGYERRTADRPAGIRTMSVVSLTACLFTLNSTFVFIIGPNRWEERKESMGEIVLPTATLLNMLFPCSILLTLAWVSPWFDNIYRMIFWWKVGILVSDDETTWRSTVPISFGFVSNNSHTLVSVHELGNTYQYYYQQ